MADDEEATVNELAGPFPISLQAVSKHFKVLERAGYKVLERAGLITRARDAQWRPCRLEVAPPASASDRWSITGRSHTTGSTGWIRRSGNSNAGKGQDHGRD